MDVEFWYPEVPVIRDVPWCATVMSDQSTIHFHNFRMDQVFEMVHHMLAGHGAGVK